VLFSPVIRRAILREPQGAARPWAVAIRPYGAFVCWTGFPVTRSISHLSNAWRNLNHVFKRNSPTTMHENTTTGAVEKCPPQLLRPTQLPNVIRSYNCL